MQFQTSGEEAYDGKILLAGNSASMSRSARILHAAHCEPKMGDISAIDMMIDALRHQVKIPWASLYKMSPQHSRSVVTIKTPLPLNTQGSSAGRSGGKILKKDLAASRSVVTAGNYQDTYIRETRYGMVHEFTDVSTQIDEESSEPEKCNTLFRAKVAGKYEHRRTTRLRPIFADI